MLFERYSLDWFGSRRAGKGKGQDDDDPPSRKAKAGGR
jgi:hypothetical protein